MIPTTPTELQCNTPSQLGTERTLTIRPCSITTRTPPHTTTAGTSHCAATHLGESGEDSSVIMAKTHHRCIRTTAHYTKPGLAAVTQATERLDPPHRRS